MKEFICIFKINIIFSNKKVDVFRYILEKRDTQQIALREELEFIDSYVFLQKERFRGNLNVDINVGESYMNNAIVSFSLQLLFENAIKHNTISSKYPLTIEVYVDADQNLVVKNNIRLKQQSIPSTGVGLANIVQRLDYFTDKPVVISDEDNIFIVKMPLLPKIKQS